jgi:hypothetical protein
VLRRAPVPWSIRCSDGRTLNGTARISAYVAPKVYGLDLAAPEAWAKVRVAEINLADQVVLLGKDAPPWRGPQDSSGTVRAAWDETYLYMLIEKTDDRFLPPGSLHGAADTVELFLNTQLAEGITENFYQLIMTAQTRSGAGFAYIPKDAVRGLVGQGTVQGHRQRIVLKIPLARLKVKPQVGSAMGFDLALNDGDAAADKRSHQMAWTGTADNWRSTAGLGRLILGK